ncbi:MAG: PAS domain S-box protein [Elusimicrobia bacterium]|nr:PAS domain S-box protein [Elusimicrobiota bacterium]MBD3412388.1 PAS domain S-box protein [Elusimicrobiota bacterium]
MPAALHRILVIDQDTHGLESIQKQIQKYNHPFAFTFARNLEAIRSMVMRREFDVIICSDQFAGGTIFDVLKLTRDIPIICSGINGTGVSLDDIIHAGAYDCISKHQNGSGTETLVHIISRACRFKELYENLHTFFGAVEQSPSTVTITDINGNIEYVNPKVAMLTGYSRGELIGENPRILKSGAQSSKIYQTLWQTISSGNEWRGEFQNKKRNGEIYWEFASISPIRSQDGSITHYIKVAEDITQRKQAEEALREANTFNETLLQTIPFGMDIVDEDGHILFINKQLHKTIDAVVIGKKCWELYKDNKKQCRLCPLKKGIVIGETDSFEAEDCFGGRIFQITHTAMMYKDKKVILEIFQDVTERKRMLKKLKEALQIKSQFTSMVSHELRTPLTAIKESIGIVLDESAGNVNEEQKHFLAIAKRNVDRLGRLINDVLDLQKLEAGRMEFDFQEENFSEIVDEACAVMQPLARKKKLSLTVHKPSKLPYIICDRDKLIQVFTNIINNAIKFTETGSINIRITRRDNVIQTRVNDSGEGISKEDLPKLFRRFQQLSSNGGRKTGGTGLGLAISREIITRHHGKIWAESERGKGTTISFLLPIRERRS